MTSIKSALRNTLGFLREAVKRRPTPIHPDPELPAKLPTVEQLQKINRTQTTSDSPLVTLWPDDQQHPSDADREAPYVTRGRYAEINHLIELIEAPPRAIHLITGPPGCGKSTMLRTMVEYATRQGFLPVKIAPEAFLNPTTVIESIRRQTLGAALAGSRLDLETQQDVTDETHVGGDVGVVKGGHKRATTDSQKQQRREEGNPELLHHLREIWATLQQKHAHIRGILIYCDEFQKLYKYSPESANEYLTLSTQIYTLNEELRSSVPSLPIVTLLAGIPPAHETLQNLLYRKSTSTTIKLLPIDGYPVHDPRSPHCTIILHDYLRASQKALGHRFHIPLAMLHIWGMECRGHALHATHAGITIQRKLQKFVNAGKERLESTDFESIDNDIRNQRKKYYRDRFQSIYTNMPDDITRAEMLSITEHVIVAMHDCKPQLRSSNNPDFLTWDTLWAIAAQALSNQDKEKAYHVLEHLQRKGIISHMQNDGRFLHNEEPPFPGRGSTRSPPPDPMPYGDCPIPTLSEHICNTITPTRMQQMRETIAQAVRKRENLATTQWHWNADIPMMKIAEIKPLDYIAPVFPRVFTPQQACEEALALLDEIQRDPDAQDPFVRQCEQDLRQHYGGNDGRRIAHSDPPTTNADEQTGPPAVTRNGKS